MQLQGCWPEDTGALTLRPACSLTPQPICPATGFPVFPLMSWLVSLALPKLCVPQPILSPCLPKLPRILWEACTQKPLLHLFRLC